MIRIPDSPVLLAWFCLSLSGCDGDPGPNVLLLLLDDFGYGDMAANRPPADAAIPLTTPNLDDFHRTSLVFSRHYADSTCSPSRAALLSGHYPSRFGFTPDGRGLAPEITTLPEAFQTAGYNTRFIGKWHTGHTTELAHPQHQGFDSWSGFLNQWMLRGRYDGNSNRLERPTYIDPWLRDETGEFVRHRGHLNDIVTELSIDYIDEAADGPVPWYLQVSFYAPHEPVQASERYAGLYPDSEEGAYRALVHQLDANIGRILQALAAANSDDETLVVIVSDNGGTGWRYPSNTPFLGVKATYTEGGTRTPLMIRWPDGRYAGDVYPHAVSLMDLYPTLLSATGIEYDRDRLDGRNVLPFLESGAAIERTLFWEAFVNGDYFYSVLDRSHRWRYNHGYLGAWVMFDLESEPSGGFDGMTENPEIRTRLRSEYLQWRRSTHRVATRFEATAANGAGILTGDSFQRSPGFGGYTFALAIHPEPSTDDGSPEIIAYQQDLLEIRLTNDHLDVSIQDIALSGQVPRDGLCHSIIVTAQYDAMISWLHNNRTIASPVELIVDGELVDSQTDFRELPKAADLTAPTYIGFSPGGITGHRPLAGRLGQARVFNHRVRLNHKANQPSAADLAQRLCPRIEH